MRTRSALLAVTLAIAATVAQAERLIAAQAVDLMTCYVAQTPSIGLKGLGKAGQPLSATFK
jgi:hypothetical protein